MNFSDSELDAKYRRLGFKSGCYGLELLIGNVRLSAAEHPWKGVVVIFTHFAARTIGEFDIAIPKRCSIEQIAAIIHVNFAMNIREEADACKRHFEALFVPIFQ